MSSPNQQSNGLESPSQLRQQVADSGCCGSEHSQLELHDQTLIFKSILDNMAEGVIVAGPRGRFLLWNPAAERILGSPHEASYQDWPRTYGMFLPDQETLCPPERFPLARALRGESTGEIELFLRNESVPDGIWVSIHADPLRDEHGALQGGIAVIRNISEQKHARDLVAHSNNRSWAFQPRSGTVRVRLVTRPARPLRGFGVLSALAASLCRRLSNPRLSSILPRRSMAPGACKP